MSLQCANSELLIRRYPPQKDWASTPARLPELVERSGPVGRGSGFKPGVIGRATDSKMRRQSPGALAGLWTATCMPVPLCCIDSQIPHDCPFQVGCRSARANVAWAWKCQALTAQWLCTWLVGWGPLPYGRQYFFLPNQVSCSTFRAPPRSISQSVRASARRVQLQKGTSPLADLNFLLPTTTSLNFCPRPFTTEGNTPAYAYSSVEF